MPKILITGSLGQIGSELTPLLRDKYGAGNVITTDIRNGSESPMYTGDVTDRAFLQNLLSQHDITEIYHLAAVLSADGERDPERAWHVNMNGLKAVLDCAKDFNCKVFWPSSIAAFGPTTPKNAPQHTIMEPVSMYGVTKKSGEDLCHYYRIRYNLDVRSIRYPGIMSFLTPPGGGTSDYAVAVFFDALKSGKYESFVNSHTKIPMMYIHDALRATIEIMSAPSESIKVHTSYNISAMSFTFEELVSAIQKEVALEVTYNPDFRQQIADSWPEYLEDTQAREDWGWRPEFLLPKTVTTMLEGVKKNI